MSNDPRASVNRESRESREFLRQSLVTGTAVMLPLIVTLIVLGIVVNFVSTQLDPVVGLITSTTGVDPASKLALKAVALATIIGVVVFVGAVAELRSEASEVGAVFDTLVSRIPGIGSLYRGLDEMSGLLMDNDTDSFREVKLVEFPIEGSYAIGFLTADTPAVVEDGADREGMLTVFVPMAPNPVMGGFVLHVSPDRVRELDMSVEEGIQSIVTSGVATGNQTQNELSSDMLERIDRRLEAADVVERFEDLEQYAAEASSKLEETARETMNATISNDDPDEAERIDPDR